MTTRKDLMLKQCVELGEAIGEKHWWLARRRLAMLVAIIVGESVKSSDDTRKDFVRSSAPRFFGNSGYSGGCTPAAVYA